MYLCQVLLTGYQFSNSQCITYNWVLFYTCGYLLVQLLAVSGIMVILVAFTFLLLRMLHVYIKHSTNLGSEDFYYV